MDIMDIGDGLRVSVRQRGTHYVWELYRSGNAQPVKFSVPIYASSEAAETAGHEACVVHLARLQKTEIQIAKKVK